MFHKYKVIDATKVQSCWIYCSELAKLKLLQLFGLKKSTLKRHSNLWKLVFYLQISSAFLSFNLLMSACVSRWTESHKMRKAWALINHVLPQCFHSYWLLLSKSNHRVKQVDISESTNINQPISMNRLYPIEALIFVRYFFGFPIIHHNSIFLAHVRRVLLFKCLTFVVQYPETVNGNLTT